MLGQTGRSSEDHPPHSCPLPPESPPEISTVTKRNVSSCQKDGDPRNF